jgi:hypothetical protein
MSVELETPVLFEEAERVLEWRIEELVRADFPGPIAFELALAPGVDLQAARRLRALGCPPDTAARILL